MKFLSALFLISNLVFGSENPNRLTAYLLNYIATDYAGAIGSDGKVLDSFEYAEQLEFV